MALFLAQPLPVVSNLGSLWRITTAGEEFTEQLNSDNRKGPSDPYILGWRGALSGQRIGLVLGLPVACLSQYPS